MIPHAAWVAEVTDVTDHSITVRQDLVSVSQVSELPYSCLITIEFLERELIDILFPDIFKGEPSFTRFSFATVYKGNIIKNLIMDCQSYTKYRPNETTGGIFVSWRRKEELPTGA